MVAVALDDLALTALQAYAEPMTSAPRPRPGTGAGRATNTATNTAAVAAAADAYVEQVSARVSKGLAQRLEALRAQGHDADALGDADSLAARMLATVPEPSPWAELGPFYSTAGIARVLGGVSRQAVEERRRRRTILALRTADGTWVYPAFQLDGRNRVVAGLTEVLAEFRPETPDDEWMVAAFVAAPQPGLAGRSIVEHLADGGDPAGAVALAAERAERWALAS